MMMTGPLLARKQKLAFHHFNIESENLSTKATTSTPVLRSFVGNDT